MPLLKKTKDGKYTLKKDGTINPHPPKFDPLDKMGKYRRMAKSKTK